MEDVNTAPTRRGGLAWRSLPALSVNLIFLGFTAVLVGYFLPWLPHQSAGLTLIGIDIGEWIKFLPQMRAGALPSRDLFYVPPVTLGIILALITAGWCNGRWQTWGMRLLAIGVSWLAFPSLEAIQFEDAGQWRARLIMIGCVVLVALGSALARRLPAWVVVGLMAGAAAAGAILPTWAYLAVRPAVQDLLGMPVGIGVGVWLNLCGHLLSGGAILWGKKQAPVNSG